MPDCSQVSLPRRDGWRGTRCGRRTSTFTKTICVSRTVAFMRAVVYWNLSTVSLLRLGRVPPNGPEKADCAWTMKVSSPSIATNGLFPIRQSSPLVTLPAEWTGTYPIRVCMRYTLGRPLRITLPARSKQATGCTLIARGRPVSIFWPPDSAGRLPAMVRWPRTGAGRDGSSTPSTAAGSNGSQKLQGLCNRLIANDGYRRNTGKP